MVEHTPALDLPPAPADLGAPEVPPADAPKPAAAGLDPLVIQEAGESLGATVATALDILLPRLGLGDALDEAERGKVNRLMVSYARARPRFCVAAAAFTPPEIVVAGELYQLIATRVQAAQAAAAAEAAKVPGA